MTTLNTVAATRLFASASSSDTAQHTATTFAGSNGTTTITPAVSEQMTTTPPVQITLSQAGLDFLSAPSSTTTAYQAATQEALNRLDALAQSSHETAREQAEERVNALKAQINQLMQIKSLLSPKALAQELAQLARQLAAAVAQYMQSGGDNTANAAVGNAVLATSQTPAATNSNSAEAQTGQTVQTNTDDAQSNDASQNTQNAAPSATPTTKTNNNQEFVQSVQELSSQMKALLEDSQKRLGKQNHASDNDLQSTQNALEAIDQMIMKI